MQRYRHGIFLSIFIAVMLFSPHSSMAAEEANQENELKAKQKQLEAIQRQLEDKRRKLSITRQKEAAVLGRLVVLNSTLKKTTQELQVNEGRLTQNEASLTKTQQQLAQERTRLQNQTVLLERRVRETYKTGGFDILELLLTGSSLSDFIHRTYFFEKLLGQDLGLLKNVQETHERVRKRNEDLKNTTDEIRALTALIRRKKKIVQSDRATKQMIYQDLAARRRQYEREVEEFAKTSNEIEAWLDRVLGEREKKGVVTKQKGSGRFKWPLRGRMTSEFGYRKHPLWRRVSHHTGLDIAAPYGTPIESADSGEVIFAGWWDGYGKAVIMDHGKGRTTVYAHMSRIYVKEGQGISQGATLGLVGSTGYSTGPHLHFEVRINGKPQNPRNYLP